MMTDLREKLARKSDEFNRGIQQRLKEIERQAQKKKEEEREQREVELHESLIKSNEAKAEFYGCLSSIIICLVTGLVIYVLFTILYDGIMIVWNWLF